MLRQGYLLESRTSMMAAVVLQRLGLLISFISNQPVAKFKVSSVLSMEVVLCTLVRMMLHLLTHPVR